MTVHVKRVHDEPSPDDGFRVLVDRLWPRGVSKERARLDLWLKDVAPSTELRTWFHAAPERFDEFASRYRAELSANPAVGQLRDLVAAHPVVTLLYGARAPLDRNHAAVLAGVVVPG
jgi:DNA-3-methyladenine glycosylase